MTKEELVEYLRENLEVRIELDGDYGDYVHVQLVLEGQPISWDGFSLPTQGS